MRFKNKAKRFLISLRLCIPVCNKTLRIFAPRKTLSSLFPVVPGFAELCGLVRNGTLWYGRVRFGSLRRSPVRAKTGTDLYALARHGAARYGRRRVRSPAQRPAAAQLLSEDGYGARSPGAHKDRAAPAEAVQPCQRRYQSPRIPARTKPCFPRLPCWPASIDAPARRRPRPHLPRRRLRRLRKP